MEFAPFGQDVFAACSFSFLIFHFIYKLPGAAEQT
jgi:hypothetical protein